MCHRLRTSVLISLGIAGWLALVPATAEAQRGRAIAQAAVNNYLNGGYGGYRGGYGGYRGGYGYPRYYGGYTTAYGNGNYGRSNYGGYPVYGYNNGGYGYGYRGGYPAFGNPAAYGLGGITRRTYFDR